MKCATKLTKISLPVYKAKQIKSPPAFFIVTFTLLTTATYIFVYTLMRLHVSNCLWLFNDIFGVIIDQIRLEIIQSTEEKWHDRHSSICIVILLSTIT